MEEEKLGTMMYDGKIYNLDNMTVEEFDELEAKLEKEEEEIRNKIDAIIELNEDTEEE